MPRATFWCTHCCCNSGSSFRGDIRSNTSVAQPRSFEERAVLERVNDCAGMVFYGDASLDLPPSNKVRQQNRRSSAPDVATPTRSSSDPPSKRMRATPDGIAGDKSHAETLTGRANAVASLGHPAQNRLDKIPAHTQNSSIGVGSSLPPQHCQPAICGRHGTKSLALKRVRKQGPNNGRLFFSCRGAGCSFFQWGDVHFPKCSCPSAPQSVLRVSKKETSGGRWFFACRGLDPGKRCNFFSWASPQQLQPLQSLLSPLT